jgi:rhamnose utilization protein RhaD (predicted bifunctional aldolase and dehydrogenase)
MREEVTVYCAAIGADPLLVQGAGGNVSWKDGDTLWIKASGTWLADAARKDIFVPVDLAHLRGAIDAATMDVQPRTLDESGLRPSIETLLHALMPHKVVVHVHAVELLAHLVRAGFPATVEARLGGSVGWAAVPYRKPGLELAAAVAAALARMPHAQVVFLQNHGVVIGANSTAEVDAILRPMLAKMSSPPLPACAAPARQQPPQAQYAPIADHGIQQLALDPTLFGRLASSWALFPDHVVFLGPRAHAYDSARAMAARQASPELVFIGGDGVYAKASFGLAKLAQLRCYYDVLARHGGDGELATLTEAQIADLLNWDAEQYRMALAH